MHTSYRFWFVSWKLYKMSAGIEHWLVCACVCVCVRVRACVCRCTRCTDSEYPCKWCIKHHICTNHATSAEACEDDIMVTGKQVWQHHVHWRLFGEGTFLWFSMDILALETWILELERQCKTNNAPSLDAWLHGWNGIRPMKTCATHPQKVLFQNKWRKKTEGTV